MIRTIVGGKEELPCAVPIIQPPLMHPCIKPPCAFPAEQTRLPVMQQYVLYAGQ